MKKKIVKIIGLLIFILVAIATVLNVYKWIVCGKQEITISTFNKAYTNSDLYISIVAEKNGEELDTKTTVRLLDANGKKVKKVKAANSGNDTILSIPDIKPGNYQLEAKVSSKAGKDKVKKEIYITDGDLENTLITFDKGIYKPGDTINYRALLTSKENDEPVVKEANVSIYDGNDNRVYNENIKTSEYGIISGAFKLADEVNSGDYKLIVKTNSTETTKQFKVNPYVTPKYEVKIDYDKQNYLVNDTAKINIHANYFFGEPVSDAKYIVYIDGEKYKEVTADAEGVASVGYIIKDAKEYNVKVEAVDSSNYYVEETSQFVAGTDIFEIELLPEHGELITGKNNNVYVFTSTADGQPVKTYVTVSSDQFTKQVATDENGIGKFVINIDDPVTLRTRTFKVTAQNMDGETVSKSISLNISSRDLLVSTNKVKYSQGEDITLNLSSLKSNIKNIYFFKNGKPIKMISTDLPNTTVNLDDTYGLIDIFVSDGTNNNSSYYKYGDVINYYGDDYAYSPINTCKRTIFIKPTKELSIGITTDKEEYKPGDAINISFNTTDENKNNIEAALLVSMLDNSILSLAKNDLSIDNIKLALQDITFSDELDAATLYSCIIDESSEETMAALLLRQQEKDLNVSEETLYNYDAKEKAQMISILLIILLVLMILIYVGIRFKKAREIIKHVINFCVYYFVITMAVYYVIDEFFWRIDFSFITMAITLVVCLVIYIVWLSRISKKLFRTSLSIIISLGLLVLLAFLLSFSKLSAIITLVVLAIIIITAAILSRVFENKNNKFMKVVTKEGAYVLKFVIAIILGTIVGKLFEEVISIYGISVPVAIIFIYLFNYLFNRKHFGEKINDNKEKKPIKNYVIIALAVIGAMTIGHFVIEYIEDNRYYLSSPVYYENERSSSVIPNNGSSIGGVTIYPTDVDSSADSSSKSSALESIFDSADSLLSLEESIQVAVENKTEEKTVEQTADDNIRNVFLESMCFIPELVTSQGNASVNLRLSDNITTWTIQTIGNTKDGKIGYGILDNVKVFKDFFVDFELPNNLVETDKISIPVTVYNYTEEPISTTLKISEENWFTLEEKEIPVNIEAQNSKMVYVPITIVKNGNFKFRVEVNGNDLTDIVEKEAKVSPKGYKIEKVVSSGILDGDISEDILILDEILEGTAKAKVKIYASTMSQAVEGIENIFRMPTGCFEQISSSLYPNILALKYMQDKGIVDENLKNKAIGYISSGYQKLLTYEVSGEKGGYSLFGYSPAETVLTAYGLMEVSDLKEVYDVEDSVIDNMTEFLYKKQKMDGSFTITGYHIGGADSYDDLSLNAYIIWALSESNPKDKRLEKSIDYLKNKLDRITDNYTLALVANALANVNDKDVDSVIKRLVNNTNVNDKEAYLNSNIYDYYGTSYNYQTIQTVALTSMALSKTSNNSELNKKLINYIIGNKDPYGTWHSTQATILALKAINEANDKSKLDNQTISVKINSDEKQIEIKDNPLDIYEVAFDNLSKENKLQIDIKKGNACYEVVQEYYIPYEKVNTRNDNIEINVECNNNLGVNEILNANIKLVNKNNSTIQNGMVTINIPQGFTTIEESLMLLETMGVIEKYETTYRAVNIYLRDFDSRQITDLKVQFRAMYPVEITGMEIRAYDYYNPDIIGHFMPIEIVVN